MSEKIHLGRIYENSGGSLISFQEPEQGDLNTETSIIAHFCL